MIRKHFRLKRILIGLAFAAVAVPTAQAKPVAAPAAAHHPISVQSQPSQLQVEGQRWQAMANAYERVAAQWYVPSRHLPQADIQAINATPSSAPAQSTVSQANVEGLRYQAMARAYLNRPGTVSAAGVVTNARPGVQTTQGDGFKWSDAGIGASVAFGVALMLLTAVALGRRNRSRPTGLAST